jgi:hypothetical protein
VMPMVRSTEIIEIIQHALPAEEWCVIGPIITEINQQQSRRARKSILTEINNVIIEMSLKNNNPALLSALPDLQNGEIEGLFSRITQQYIQTKDEAWLNSFLTLSEKLEKKSNQSRVFAMIARDLIDAGVTEADSGLISTGMIMLNRISFRKYRSEIMIDIIPLLIVWAITIRDKKILHTSLKLIEEIGDISKRSILHAELVKALATIAILDKDRISFIDSIQSTTEIHQKIRRQQCLLYIIEKGVKSHFGQEMADIPQFMNNFMDISHEAYLEVISTLAGQVLERIKDKAQVIAILDELCEKNPSVTSTIVIDLLNKAERSGDPWFLSTSMMLQKSLADSEKYPVREIIRAGISVARKSNNMQILTDLIPLINNRCNPAILSRIYLQFAQIMLASGDFRSAMGMFGETSRVSEEMPQYSDTLTHLIKEGVLKDAAAPIIQAILPRIDKDTANTAVYRAVTEVSKEYSFNDIIAHIGTIKELIALHPRQDNLILEKISILIDRGFLDSHDPDILIRLAEFMQEQPHKERAISNIVIKIAKMGVQTKNRDFLQRAVGLTCEIDGQNTRSVTLSSIIDEASILAAQQGDLDLLLRMRVWSSSLLETDLATYAMANIVDGIIKYAVDRQSTEALEEAYKIAQDITDSALKSQMFERIAECFVKIGCTILINPRYPSHDADLSAALQPFERGLEIISQNIKSPHLSLKIAGIIDVIISFSRTSNNPDFVIPLALYTVEIENTYERDAMMSRIISNMSEDLIHPDSTDPYEIMAYLLQRNEGINTYPIITTLISGIIQRITNPYAKLTGLCNLLDAAIKSKDFNRSLQIRREVCFNLPNLPTQYQKILILSDLATLYSHTEPQLSTRCIQQAIQHLESVEIDKDELARRHIVIALVSLHGADPKAVWINSAVSIIQKISNPVDYIHSLISVYRMAHQNKDQCNEFLQNMIQAADRISSPYEKASTLLDIVPLAIHDCGDTTIPETLLKKTELLTKKINIPSIADTLRDNIAHVYAMLYQKQNDKRYLSQAIQIAKTIDDDNVRLQRFVQLGYSEAFEVTHHYAKIKSLSETIAAEGVHPNQIAILERLVRTVADRGRESILFCDLAIFFKREGEEKLSKRMVLNAIKEARIIRPLSRRSFVMCDIALKFYSAGCEHTAQDILDYSIDAATNIRQSTLRDEVFDELGHAIKIMQEM